MRREAKRWQSYGEMRGLEAVELREITVQNVR